MKHKDNTKQQRVNRPRARVAALKRSKRKDERAVMEHKTIIGTAMGGRFIVFLRDISERKRAAKALQQSHDKLEKRVTEQAAELTNASTALQIEITRRKKVDKELLRVNRALRTLSESNQALRESEKRFRALIENNSDAITLVSADGTVLYDSPSVSRILGYSPEERVGKMVFEYMHPDARSRASEHFAQFALQPGAHENSAGRFRHKDGSWIWIEGVRSNLLAEPSVRAIVVNYRDSTERKQAEEALKASEEKHRTVLENIDEIVYQVLMTERDPLGGKIQFVSRRAEDIIGWKPEEFLEDPHLFSKLLHPDDLPVVVEQQTRTILAGGQGGLREFRMRHKTTGAYRWIEDRVVLQRDDSKVVGMFGVARDVTDRKRAEEALRETNERLRALIRASPLAIIALDSDGIVQDWNHAAERIFGWSEQEALGKPNPIVPAGEQERYHTAIAQLLEGKEFGDIEARRLKKDGTLVETSLRAAPLHDAQGNVIGLMAVVADITARKRAEQEILRRNEELTALDRIGQAVSRMSSPSEMLEQICTVLGQALDNRNLYIALYDEASQSISFPVYAIEGETRAPASHPFGKGITEYVIRTQAPLLITSNLQTALAQRGIDLIGRVAHSFLAVPMLAGEKAIGVIVIQDYEKENAFDARHLELFSTIASQVVSALENARLFEETRQRLGELEAVNKVSTALRAAQTLDEMLPLLLDETLAVLNMSVGTVWLYDPANDELRRAVARGWVSEIVPPAKPREGIVGHVFATGQAYLSREVKQDQHLRESVRPMIPPGWGSGAVPIRAAQDIVGVLFVSFQLPRELTTNEVRLLTTLAEITGNAIHRTRLHEQTVRDASELALAYDATIEGWSHALDLRDKETEGHTQRVTELTLRLARAMGMSEEELVHVRRGGLLHDIGKMGIPDSILRKPGPLTNEEWGIMRKHPVYAYALLSPIAYLHPALDIPYCHHEKWDGTGYPRGLTGEQIPLTARIFALVDVWDALLSDRPYRAAWLEDQVREYIREQAGKHFDPMVVEMFLRMERDAVTWREEDWGRRDATTHPTSCAAGEQL